jgi:spermidine synthase/MFS family permease
MLINQRLAYLLLIFIIGGIVLSLELITSRILAPFFGVSLYIWTAILSTTLTFLALGYQLGGWFAKKVKLESYSSLLLSIPILSSFFIFLSCLLYPLILPTLLGAGLILGSFIGCCILLAFPLTLLSSMNPMLIAFFRQSNDNKDVRKDSGVGFVFFVSTIGSVTGVLTTALLLVSNIQNYSAMIFNGIFLGLFTLLVNFITKENRPRLVNAKISFASITIILLFFSLFWWKDVYLDRITSGVDARGAKYKILSEYPSHYGNIKVVGYFPQGKKELSHYMLLQNGVVQNKIGMKGNPLSPYVHTLGQLMTFAPQAKRALVLGFGAGELPRIFNERGLEVSAVEINPDTLSAAKEFFHFKQGEIKVFFEDARTFVKNCDESYDVIVLDLFHGDGMPEHIITREFFQDINKCLSSDGVLLTNFFISLGDKKAKMSLLATVSSVFGSIYFFYDKLNFNKHDKIRFTSAQIVASKTDLPMKINFDLSNVPKQFKGKVLTTLKTYKLLRPDSFIGYEPITDKGNAFSSLFAETVMEFRKTRVAQIPPRVLIN